MCLYPIIIPNPMYKSSIEVQNFVGKDFKWSGRVRSHRISSRYDLRIKEKEYAELGIKGFQFKDVNRYREHIVVPCRRCQECLRSDAAQWRFRLEQESLRYSSSSRHIFVTLTFSDDYYDYDNPIDCTKYVRSFSDTLYLYFGRRLRHWYVTELGEKTHRLHLHGIIFDFPKITDSTGFVLKGKALNTWFESNLWKYGFVWIGYVDNRTYNYVTKYITKSQKTDWYHKPKIFCSPCLGNNDKLFIDYLSRLSLTSGDFVYSRNGKSRMLPKYYRNQLRKYLSSAEYYRCLDRSMSQLGTKLVVLGRRYDSVLQYKSALSRARRMYENAFSERVNTFIKQNQKSVLDYGYTAPV